MPLDQDSVEKLRALLASSGWRDVMEPSLIDRTKRVLGALRSPPAKRSGEFKDIEDENLRGRLDEIEWWLVAFRNEVTVFDHNQRLGEPDAAHGEPVGKDPGHGRRE